VQKIKELYNDEEAREILAPWFDVVLRENKAVFEELKPILRK